MNTKRGSEQAALQRLTWWNVKTIGVANATRLMNSVVLPDELQAISAPVFFGHWTPGPSVPRGVVSSAPSACVCGVGEEKMILGNPTRPQPHVALLSMHFTPMEPSRAPLSIDVRHEIF
jgi:hypothetical protein